MFRDGGSSLVRSRRPLFIHFSFSIVGAISDCDFGKVGSSTDLFGLNVDDLQGGSDDKVPSQERSLHTGRFVSGYAVHHESGATTTYIVWRRKKLAFQRKARVVKSIRGVRPLRL